MVVTRYENCSIEIKKLKFVYCWSGAICSRKYKIKEKKKEKEEEEEEERK